MTDGAGYAKPLEEEEEHQHAALAHDGVSEPASQPGLNGSPCPGRTGINYPAECGRPPQPAISRPDVERCHGLTV